MVYGESGLCNFKYYSGIHASTASVSCPARTNVASWVKLVSLNEHALNKIIRTQSLLWVIDCATPLSGRGIKGGTMGESDCHAHGQDGQIKLIKGSCTQHWCIVYNIGTTLQTLNQDSVYVYGGCYFSDHFCAELSWQPLLCHRKVVRREIECIHKCLGFSQRKMFPFSSW